MSYLCIDNVRIAGISACVPKNVQQVEDFQLFTKDESANFSRTIGVEERRVASINQTALDLCYHAAERLISDLQWGKDEIECLVFVTQTPDYVIPASSPILQHRLGLSTSCLTLDISLGCSGWVYGLSTISSLLSHGSITKGLLLVGDTILKTCSEEDKSTYPLFGDAGSATALEFNQGATKILFNLMSDGEGSDVIKINSGGYRSKINEKSFTRTKVNDGVKRNDFELILEGMDVFTFGISKAPKTIKNLFSYFDLQQDSVDYFVLHQANKMMNEKIRNKLSISEDKFPYSISKFGNTSCASIPLTMVTALKEALNLKDLNIITCGFGVGLSWGSAYFQAKSIVVSDLIEI